MEMIAHDQPLTVLMDLEGVLLDPLPGLLRSLRRALIRAGRPVALEHDLSWVLDRPMAEAVATLLGTAEPKQVSDTLAHLRCYHRRFGRLEQRPYPGAGEAIRQLASNGQQRLAYLCSADTVSACQQLERSGFIDSFHRLFCTRSGGCDRVKTRILAHAVCRGDLDPRRALWITDDPAELRAAGHMGMDAIGVAWGRGERRDLHAATAGPVAREPAELPQLVATTQGAALCAVAAYS